MNSDVDGLYVHRSLGGRGLLSIANTVQRERNSLGYYLPQSSEPILQLISDQGWFDREEPTSHSFRTSTWLHGWRRLYMATSVEMFCPW